MAKITLPDVGSLANQLSAQSAINSNFTAIENAWENNLSRDGTAPNQMEADLDMNSNTLLNVADPVAETDGVNLRSVRPLVNQFAGEIAETIIEGTLRVNLFTATAAQTAFPLTDTPGTVENVQVSVNGLIKIPGVDYTLSGADLKTLEFFVGLTAGDKVIARYTQLSPADSLLRSDLISTVVGKGSALVAWIGSAVGSVARTVLAKLREHPSVMDFGAVGDGVTDDTVAIQAAIDSGFTDIYFPDPASSYLISAALNISGSGITLHGANQLTTLIKQSTSNAKIFNNTGSRNTFRDLRLEYVSTPTVGGTAIHSSGSDTRIARVLINSCWNGIYFTTASGQMANCFQILNYENTAVFCQAVTDVFCSQFIFNAGNATRGAAGGIRLEDKCEAVVFSDGDILNGVYSLFTTSAAYTVSNRPAYCNFSNLFFDSSAQGSSVANMVESEFVGCWFSGGRSGGGFPGLLLGQTASLKFTNCRFFNCGTHGCSVQSTSIRLGFVNCAAHSNSFTAGVGVAHGWNFAGTVGFALSRCTGGNGLSSGAQGYAIALDASCNNFSIRDCHLSGNATGGISDASPDTNVKYISGNIGFTTQSKGTGSVAVGQTVATVTHLLTGTPLAEDIIITPTTLMSASSITSWRVTSVGATTFQVQTNAAVAGTAFTFSWNTRFKGA